MTPESDLRNSIIKLSGHFNNEDLLNISSREAFHDFLTSAIVDLLVNDMEKLLQLLYRVDVNEAKVKSAFAQNDPKLIAPVLADLLIDRELEKAETRRRYK